MESNQQQPKGKGKAQPHNVRLSKTMSYFLRHGAKEHGIEMTDDGFIRISDLMATKEIKKLKVKLSDVLDWVANNEKKRFQIKVDPQSDMITLENGFIRASQGHSIKGLEEEKLLIKITFPYKYSTIVHGTYSKVLEPILEQGLSKMARTHIHLAKGFTGDKKVISGMRGSCDVFVEVNVNRAAEDGVAFFESANGVVLTAGVDGYLPPKYFRCVRNKKQEVLHMAPLDFIVVFDFEAICDKDGNDKFEVQEIIEFPAVIIDCKSKQIVAGFQTYVKPTQYPKLTDFWTELTGITQEQVDSGVGIDRALLLFHEFLRKHGVLGSEFVLMSCGDYDAKALRREAEHKGLFVANYMKQWINIKKVFPLHLYKEETKDKGPVINIKKVRPVVKGMPHMLEVLGLDLLGRHHCGFDDSLNIARCAVKCMQDGFTFDFTHIATLEYSASDEAAANFEKAWLDEVKDTKIPEIDTSAYLEGLTKQAAEDK